MSAWTTIPCLLILRDEFNAVSPNRDKSADGTIADGAHSIASDHYPDEDSSVLKSRDADSRNEVHALDIDSTGPWPEPGWFNEIILEIVEREKKDFEHPTTVGRLQNVIWNRRIASRSWRWEWRDYDGSDPHTNHAHFSGRYVTEAESSTRPWGVEDSVALNDDDKKWIANTVKTEVGNLLKAKIGDAAHPDRTWGDVLRDVAKLRGFLIGDVEDTKNAALAANAPLVRLLADVQTLIDRDLPVDQEALTEAMRTVLREGTDG